MNTRRAVAMLLNVAGVLVPTAALYARYGVDAKIESRNAEYLLPLAGAMVASFLVGTLSARTLRSSAEGFMALFGVVTKALQAETDVRSRHANRTA